ncbi:MAG TPA: cyclophilin-like fold protein, partial [Burkholderiales bacterium]|nr:cyclophilin-like fold protein [Burkholderiales bacterium]
QLLPQALDMSELNGNEKYARLPRSLPTNAVRPGTIHRGDVLLYGRDALVVFYETFESNYSYTRIGRIADSAGLAEALGSGDQRISFMIQV